MAKKIASSAPRKSAAAKASLPAKRGRKGVQCRNLSNEQRASLLQSLLKHRTSGSGKGNKKNTTNNNTTDKTQDENNDADNSNSNAPQSTKLRKGALLEASKAFGVSTKTCKRIWERFLETCNDNGSGGDVSHRKHQSGRPKKISSQELHQKIQELPLETRSTVRGLARALGMPHTTIHRRLKSGEIQLEPLASTTRTKQEDANDATEDKTTNTIEETKNANGRTKSDKSAAKKPKGKGNVKANSNAVKKEPKQEGAENGFSEPVVKL